MLTHSQKHIDAHRSRQALVFFNAVDSEMTVDGDGYDAAFVEVASTWPVELDWQPI